MFLRSLFLISLITLVVACVPTQTARDEIACDTLIEPTLLELDHDAMTEAAFVEWVSTHYGERDVFSESDYYEGSTITIADDGNTSTSIENPDWDRKQADMLEQGLLRTSGSVGPRYKWTSNGRSYEASFDTQNGNPRFLTVIVTFENDPLLRDLERCFGMPASYEARFYTHQSSFMYLIPVTTYETSLYLYYPDQGLVFGDSREGNGDSKPVITETTPIERVSIMRRTTLQEQMKDLVPGFEWADLLDGVQEFPGTWEQMEYPDPPQRD